MLELASEAHFEGGFGAYENQWGQLQAYRLSLVLNTKLAPKIGVPGIRPRPCVGQFVGKASLEWWRAYSHFIRPHESLGQKVAALRRPRLRSLGVSARLWTVGELLRLPLWPALA